MAQFWTEDPTIGNALAGLAESFSYKSQLAAANALEDLKKKRAQAAATTGAVSANDAMWNAVQRPTVPAQTPYQESWVNSSGARASENVPLTGGLPPLRAYTPDITAADERATAAEQAKRDAEFDAVRAKQLADYRLGANYATSMSDVAGAAPKMQAQTALSLYGAPQSQQARDVINAQLGHELKTQDVYGTSADNMRTIDVAAKALANNTPISAEQVRQAKVALDLEYGITKPHIAGDTVLNLREKGLPPALEPLDRALNPHLYQQPPPAATAAATAPPPAAPTAAQAPPVSAPAATVTTTGQGGGGALPPTAAQGQIPAPTSQASVMPQQQAPAPSRANPVVGAPISFTPSGPANDQLRRVATAMQQVQPERQKLEDILGFKIDPDGKFTIANPGALPGYRADAINRYAGDIGYGKNAMDYMEGREKGAPNPALRSWYGAAKAWVEPVLRLASGAAINPGEYASYYSMFIPSPGDPPDVIAQKFGRMRQWEIAVSQSVNAGGAMQIMQKLAPEREDVQRMRVLLTNNPGAAQKPFADIIATTPGAQGSPAVPPAAAAPQTSADQQALSWANANPNDPRAAAIKKRLGM
jgi:hypothetical protein